MFVFNFTYYASAKAFCQIHEIDYGYFTRNYNRGVHIKDILAGKPPKRTGYTLKGHHYHTIEEVAQAFNITKARIDYWLRKKGYDLETVVDMQKNAHIAIEIEDVHYPSLRAACAAYNVDYVHVLSKYSQEGLTHEQAILKAKEDNKQNYDKRIEYQGKTYRSLQFLCEVLDVNTTNVKKYLRNGLALEQAIEHEKTYGIGCVKKKLIPTG